MPAPEDVTGVRRFLGMANQLGRFAPQISEMSQPLRELLSSKNCWSWGPVQQNSFESIKTLLSDTPTLVLFDPQKDTKVTADASSYGLGAAILQKHDDIYKPVAYASRSLTPTERRYAQVEKEALGVTWACDCFSDYLIGIQFQIETDHRPLIPLLGSKSLEDLPARIQRFRIRLMQFDYSISYVPGKLLYTADALSRAPQTGESTVDEVQDEAESLIEAVLAGLPASQQRLEEIRRHIQEDEVSCCI